MQALMFEPGRGQKRSINMTASSDTMSPRYYWFLIFFMLGLSCLGSFVNDMYTPSFPELCRFFGCSVSTMQLGLTMSLAGAAAGQFVMGPVSDHAGRKPVLLTALIVAAASTLLCIWSRNIATFLVFRFFQGTSASGGYFMARTIPTDLYRGRSLASFMAMIGAINGIAPAAAPILGGFISETFTWKGVFVTLAVISVVLICILPKFRESLPGERRVPLSPRKSLATYGALLRNRAFMTHVMLKAFALALMFAYISSAPFILEEHYGFSESHYGIVIGVNAVFLAAGSMLAPRFHPFKKAAFVGAAGLFVFIIAESVALYTVHSFWLYEGLLCPALVFCGMIFASANTLAMNEGRANAGEASAVLGISGYIIGGIASPLVGLGDIMHGTAIVFAGLASCILVMAFRSRRIAPDLNS